MIICLEPCQTWFTERAKYLLDTTRRLDKGVSWAKNGAQCRKKLRTATPRAKCSTPINGSYADGNCADRQHQREPTVNANNNFDKGSQFLDFESSPPYHHPPSIRKTSWGARVSYQCGVDGMAAHRITPKKQLRSSERHFPESLQRCPLRLSRRQGWDNNRTVGSLKKVFGDRSTVTSTVIYIYINLGHLFRLLGDNTFWNRRNISSFGIERTCLLLGSLHHHHLDGQETHLHRPGSRYLFRGKTTRLFVRESGRTSQAARLLVHISFCRSTTHLIGVLSVALKVSGTLI